MDIQTWIGALLTLMIFSFLYKDNAAYKFAEHLFVGVSAAYWMVQGFWQQIMPNLFGKLAPGMVDDYVQAAVGQQPDLVYIIPLILGLLLLCRLVPPVAWLSRWSMAFIIGYTAGSNLTRYLASDFLSQVQKTLELPLISTGQDTWLATIMFSISNIVIVGGVVCGLIYFYFSKEHTGLFGRASRAGIWVLMVAFGASFGYTVMARISLLIGRIEYLRGWLQGIFS